MTSRTTLLETIRVKEGTAPLWGLRLSGSTRLLHDGRARSFEDAIVQHDGQGAHARAAFRSLSERERQQLVAFLATL